MAGEARKVIPVILALVTPLLSASQCELTDSKPTEPDVQLTLIAKPSKHENAKQPHWAQARSSCWGTRSPPL